MMRTEWIRCSDCVLRTKPVFRPLSDQELDYVIGLKADHVRFPARAHIVEAGESDGFIYTLYDGWAFRYAIVGETHRQILEFLLPGDLIGLKSPMSGRVRHSVCSITDVVVCALRERPLDSLVVDQPDLAKALFETLLIEEDRARDRLTLLGRQRASQRLAYLMLDLHDRLLERDMAVGNSFEFPLTYEMMADALGLSRAQLARSLVDLRERGWATLHGGSLSLSGRAPMAEFCGYRKGRAQQRALL